jgi:hypothetical protein
MTSQIACKPLNSLKKIIIVAPAKPLRLNGIDPAASASCQFSSLKTNYLQPNLRVRGQPNEI